MEQSLQRSSRDLQSIQRRLVQLVTRQLPRDAEVVIGELIPTSANGMSSETLLFDVGWFEGGEARSRPVVARVAPDPEDVPVFPRYDLPGQFRTMSLVAALSSVPVPTPWFCEEDLFVMDRVEGQIPPDVMPYNFGDNWLYDATPQQQRRLQDSSVGVLAALGSIDRPQQRFSHLDADWHGDTPLPRHFNRSQEHYRFAAADCGRSALVESGFAWLESHWPLTESPPVLCWGDARIGNVIYRDFEPVAVLDWEMAFVGPPELDLGWMIYLHQMFEDIAHQAGLEGMPAFMRADDAAASYEALTGRTPRHLDWYIAYACVQMAVMFLRTGWRQVHFGERPPPSNADELPLNAPALRALVARPD
jgi:aminoglycoside phosphotransferase (APT) family kinase protein